ncbi:transporter substrate-binding domain-containing protein [Leeia sp. TBRC 13508]|uniref:Transporter substrate-binding domain-containing protein n=1 Tax=Leeia speluncae TaxID=2884804 RepID=A0ABS8DAC4_9NEIS|nr:transporter substrate-binding domain-containing protein [Leeia speluncae]MCB6185112.1 transporter substrate-binding domain-containing protein [Leeia speluncae]
MKKIFFIILSILPIFSHSEILKIGIQGEFPPFDYVENNQLKGFNVDFAKRICEIINAKCQLKQVPWVNMIKSVENGDIDVAVSLISITEERKKLILFSHPYTHLAASFAAKKKQFLSTYITQMDLKDKVVAYQSGTIYEKIVKERFPTIKSVGFNTQKELYAALAESRVDAIFNDMVSTYEGFLKTSAGKNFEFIGSPVRDKKIQGDGEGVAVNLKNVTLINRINKAIDQIQASGEYDQMSYKYFIFSIK